MIPTCLDGKRGIQGFKVQVPWRYDLYLLKLIATYSLETKEITPEMQRHVPDDRDFKTKTISLFAKEK